jgi:hypothetical protein
MAVVDEVTISADGEWIPAPSGTDTTTIKVVISRKHVYISPPAAVTDGRPLKLILTSQSGDSHLSINRRGFAIRDDILGKFPAVCSVEPIVLDMTYCTTVGPSGQWMITGFAQCRDVSVHGPTPDLRNFTSVLSNTGWVSATGSSSAAAILADIIGGTPADGVHVTGNYSLELALDNLQERAASIEGYVQALEWDNGPDGVIKLYARLKNNSTLTTAGTSYTITVSINGGAGQTTASLASNAAAATIQAAIEALSNVGAGKVKVSTRGATNKEIVFAQELGTGSMTATGATIGEDLGEIQIWQSSTADDVTLDITQYNHWWLVPVTRLEWPPTTRFSVVLRADFSGADTTGAYMIINAGYGPPEPFAYFSSSSTTTPSAGYQYRLRFTGSSTATWSVPDQDQFPDFPGRGNGEREYVNAGTSTLTLTRTGINRFYQGGAYSTSIVLGPGETARLIPDGFNWNVTNGVSFIASEASVQKILRVVQAQQ